MDSHPRARLHTVKVRSIAPTLHGLHGADLARRTKCAGDVHVLEFV